MLVAFGFLVISRQDCESSTLEIMLHVVQLANVILRSNSELFVVLLSCLQLLPLLLKASSMSDVTGFGPSNR